MFKFLIAFFAGLLFVSVAEAQNPLPDFSVEDLGKNRIRVSWVNPFNDACLQLNVQRSYDSIKNYTTIFSTTSPELPQNGFVDNGYYGGKVYYRIFYVLTGGAYYFSKPKRAGAGYTTQAVQVGTDSNLLITVFFKNTVLTQLHYPQFLVFRDSITNFTRDSLLIVSEDKALLKPFNPGAAWVPSTHIFTNKDGFVKIYLPDAKDKKYKIVFFDEDGSKLFTINHLSDTELILDKTNFIHAGWFDFEIFADDKMYEKNKVFLQQDF